MQVGSTEKNYGCKTSGFKYLKGSYGNYRLILIYSASTGQTNEQCELTLVIV